ncbi:MAG: GC-type dockerin domain-anchored protein [Planctomycetota bacterium]
MTRCIAAVCGIAIAATAAAQETRSVVAFETGTIRVDGPRPPDFGDFFFNIQGEGSPVEFRSYGTARWDLTAVQAEFDAAFPGGWEVTAVTLEMTQDNAGFTADGLVDVFISTDDTTDAKTAGSPLFWPFFDAGSGDPQLPLAEADPILSYLFFEIETGTIDAYDQSGGPGGGVEALALTDAVRAEIEGDEVMTWVFVEAEAGVVATYRGQTEFMGREGPKLIITAEGDGSGTCRPDIDGDGSLTIFDFLAFQNLFDAGDLAADFDGDGSLTIFDFLEFQNEFDAGCP